jgi:hypothetical protein
MPGAAQIIIATAAVAVVRAAAWKRPVFIVIPPWFGNVTDRTWTGLASVAAHE